MPGAIESRVLSELPFLSHVVVVGEQRPYLACLMTLSVRSFYNIIRSVDSEPFYVCIIMHFVHF